MDHLSEERLQQLVFDEAALSAPEQAHVATCRDCQTLLNAIRQLKTEMQLAKQGEPPAAVRSRAYQLFAKIQQQPSRIQRIIQQLQAQLLWDSRQPLAMQGVRSASSDGYHLLYRTEQVEIELDVQRVGGNFSLAGDLLPANQEDIPTPVLMHWRAVEPNGPVYESKSDDAGHFHVPQVAPGRYTLLLTPQTGPLLEVEGLEFA